MLTLASRGLLMLVCWFAIASSVFACMSPSATNPAVCPSADTSCSSTVFGVPAAKLARKSTPTSVVHSLRGGALHEPETLEDVNSLILNAGSAGQLVVIDFTAT